MLKAARVPQPLLVWAVTSRCSLPKLTRYRWWHSEGLCSRNRQRYVCRQYTWWCLQAQERASVPIQCCMPGVAHCGTRGRGKLQAGLTGTLYLL